MPERLKLDRTAWEYALEEKGLMLAKNPTFCGGSKESKSTSDEVTFRVDMPGTDARDVNWSKISVITIPTAYWWSDDPKSQ